MRSGAHEIPALQPPGDTPIPSEGCGVSPFSLKGGHPAGPIFPWTHPRAGPTKSRAVAPRPDRVSGMRGCHRLQVRPAARRPSVAGLAGDRRPHSPPDHLGRGADRAGQPAGQ